MKTLITTIAILFPLGLFAFPQHLEINGYVSSHEFAGVPATLSLDLKKQNDTKATYKGTYQLSLSNGVQSEKIEVKINTAKNQTDATSGNYVWVYTLFDGAALATNPGAQVSLRLATYQSRIDTCYDQPTHICLPKPDWLIDEGTFTGTVK